MIQLIASPALEKHIPVKRMMEKLELVKSSQALQYHLAKMKFDHRYTKPINLSGLEIANILLMTDFQVFFDVYTQNYFAWKFVPVNAHVPSHRADLVKFNTRQLHRRTPSEWEETGWHELVHIADQLSEMRFDHGDNDLSGDDDSAPVKFAKFMAGLTFHDESIQKIIYDHEGV